MGKTNKEVWFITASANGLGAACAREALKQGKAVVATGRHPDKVREAVGESEDLLITELDVLKKDTIKSSVDAAIEKFGKIDVLLNNAGVFYAGYFENTSDEQWRRQMDIDFFGTQNVTREVLPHMRKERSGLVINTSSAGGLLALDYCAVYAASKFATEGWTESLRYDLAPFGIKVILAEPGFMRSRILEPGKIVWPDLDIEDYRKQNQETIDNWKKMDGTQPGDPEKYAQALLEITTWDDPPFRYMAGADAIQFAETKIKELQEDIDKQRHLTEHLGYDDDISLNCFEMSKGKK